MDTPCPQSNATFMYHCRFCATKTDRNEMIDLTEETPLAKYMEMLTILKLPMDLSQPTPLPKYICLRCHKKCSDAYNFFVVFERSQKILSLLYSNNINDKSNYTDVVQNIAQGNNEIKPEIVDNNHESINTKTEINLQGNVINTLELPVTDINNGNNVFDLNDKCLNESTGNGNSKNELEDSLHTCDDSPITNEMEHQKSGIINDNHTTNNCMEYQNKTSFTDNVKRENIEFVNITNQVHNNVYDSINQSNVSPNVLVFKFSSFNSTKCMTEQDINLITPNIADMRSEISALPIDSTKNAARDKNITKCISLRNTDTNVNMTEQNINPLSPKIADLRSEISALPKDCTINAARDKNTMTCISFSNSNTSVNMTRQDINLLIPNIADMRSEISALPIDTTKNAARDKNTTKCISLRNTDTNVNVTEQNFNPLSPKIADPRSEIPALPIDSTINAARDKNTTKCISLRNTDTNVNMTRQDINPITPNIADLTSEISTTPIDSTNKATIDKNTVQNDPKHKDTNILLYNNIPVKDVFWKNDDTENSWTNYLWSCIYCKDDFASMEDVRDHAKSIHDRCFGFKCTDCDDDFNMFNTFVEHVRLHRECLRLYCQYCNEKYEDSEQCHEHSLTHWDTQKVCDLCGEVFADQTAVVAHRNTYKRRNQRMRITKRKPKVVLADSSMSWVDYEWTCLDCFKDEPSLESLRRHMREAHNKCFTAKCADCLLVRLDFHGFARHARQHRPYLQHYCEHCNEYFADPSDLAPHVKQHFTRDKTCYGCGDIFPTDELLTHHLLNYNAPPRRFISEMSCEICSRTFQNISKLKLHMLTHNPKREKYVCNVCGKTFAASGFQEHMKLHSDVLKTCKICNKSYRSELSLKKHARSHISDRPYICDICGKNYKRKEHIVSHLECHSDVKRFACAICGKKFRTNSQLKNHSVQHSGLKVIQCSFCERSFANKSNCNKHMQRKHGEPLFKMKVTPMGKIRVDALENIAMDDKTKEWLSDVTRKRARGKKSKAAKKRQ